MFNYNKLEESIKRSGKTKTYLCKQLGRPPYYLRDVIRQRNTIPAEYQEILAREIGVTVSYLNDIEEEQKNTPTPKSEGSDTRRKIEALLDDMSDDQLKRYLEVLQVLQK